MKKLRKTKAVGLVLILTTVGAYAVLQPEIVKTTATSETSLIQDNLVELSEWTALKYEYSNVIVSRTEKSISLPGKDINFAEAIKLIEYSGYLKAGTDLSKVEVDYNETTKKITVKVMKSKILDNVVETDKARVEDIKGNIFSDYPTQFIFDEINEEKKQLEEDKISQGFLEEADLRLRQLLTSFLRANGFIDITIDLY